LPIIILYYHLPIVKYITIIEILYYYKLTTNYIFRPTQWRFDEVGTECVLNVPSVVGTVQNTEYGRAVTYLPTFYC